MIDFIGLKQLQFAFPKTPIVTGFAYEFCGSFFLWDRNTCNANPLGCIRACNLEILKIHYNESITGVLFDSWLSSDFGERCDWILFDSGLTKKRFAFCELSCCKEKYSTNKRSKAFSQIEKSWNLISNNAHPMFFLYILGFQEKTGIFGWRESQSSVTLMHSHNKNQATFGMSSFLNTPASMVGISMISGQTWGYNFNFYQVKYPSTFNW